VQENTRKIIFAISIVLMVFVSISFAGLTSDLGSEKKTSLHFPEYSVIKPNVRFWKKVYSEFTTHQGIIHDNQNLDIIYETIQLEPPNGSRNLKANQRKINAVKEKYKTILNSLASGKTPETKTEKRVFSLFAGQQNPQSFKDAIENIRFQLGQMDRFREGIIRSGAYIGEIRKIMKSYGLPEQLAYLPHVESSYNYNAYSKFGAAGIWQFTRGTGKNYMKIDYTIDERRDPILATHAAAKYLKKNYEQLGSWPIALTAYNHGANGMAKAKREVGNDYPSIYKKYKGKSFGFASRNFYSEFLAASEVARNYKKHFGELPIHPPVRRVTIPMSSYASVSDISKFYKVTKEQIQEMNPALRNPVFQGQKYIPKGYSLYLPDTKRSSLKVAQAIPKDLLKPQQKPTRFYRVQKEDTAGGIAEREGISLKELILANQLDSRARIVVGQHLRIPAPEEKLLLASISKPGQEQSKKSKKIQIQEPVEKAEPEKQEQTPTPVSAPDKKDLLVADSGSPSAREVLPPAVKPESTAAPASAPDQKELLVADAGNQPVREVPPPAAVPEPPPVPASAPDQKEVMVADSGSQSVKEVLPPAVKPESMAAPVTTPDQKEVLVADSGSQSKKEVQPSSVMPEPPSAPESSNADPEVFNPAALTGHLEVEKVIKQGKIFYGIIRVEAEETLGHYADWLELPTQKIRIINGMKFKAPLQMDQKLKIPFTKVTKEEFEEKRYEFHKGIEEDFFSAFRIVKVRDYQVKKGESIWSLSLQTLDLPLWLIKKYNPDLDLNNLKPATNLKIPVVKKIEE
jgi:membrane-bound lytic murein transglycosylase D